MTKTKPKQAKRKKTRRTTAAPKAPRALTPKQRLFAKLVAEGEHTDAQAYRAAYGKDSPSTASQLRRKPLVNGYIQGIRQLAQAEDAQAAAGTVAAKLEFLETVIYTPLKDLDEGHLAAKKITEKDTEHGSERTVEKCDPLRAIDLHSRLAGHYKEQETLDTISEQLAALMAKVRKSSF